MTKTVLFLCRQNAGRSQMAEACFNALVNREDVFAISAGTEPANDIHSIVRTVLKEEGLTTKCLHPKMLTKEMAEGVDAIYTLCDIDCVLDKDISVTQHIDIKDPHGKSKEEVRSIFSTVKQVVSGIADSFQSS